MKTLLRLLRYLTHTGGEFSTPDAKLELISQDDVRDLYMLLLSREPESQIVVEEKVRGCSTLSDLIDEIVLSDEFVWRWRDHLCDPHNAEKILKRYSQSIRR